jgi:hypothetical protein
MSKFCKKKNKKLEKKIKKNGIIQVIRMEIIINLGLMKTNKFLFKKKYIIKI